MKEETMRVKELTKDDLREQLETAHDRLIDEAAGLLGIAALMRNLSDDAELDAKELRGLGEVLAGIGNTIEAELPPV
jgi:hypothetical protein